MTEHLAVPFASGREADVYAFGDGRLLRRYRDGADATGEAQIMAYAAALGFPVPRVHEAHGPDIVMERLDGPTMAQALLRGALSVGAGATMLADLLRRLHEVPARGATGCLVHLDLHPENVLLTGRGPVVIDWHNAGDGPADLDTAFTALILAQVAIGSIAHPLGAGAVAPAGVMLDRFLVVAPGDPVRLLNDAVAIRAKQSTMSAEEVAALGVAAARVRGVK